MSTSENLKAAFSGESQASCKYRAFAEKAESERFTNVAKLFIAASASESIHAMKHLMTVGEVKSTVDNLRLAISGENYEHTKMYPEFINEARKEGNKLAETSFNYANEAEKAHERYFSEALKSIENGVDIPETDIWVCKGCGFTMLGEAPDKCPVCGAPKTMFMKF